MSIMASRCAAGRGVVRASCDAGEMLDEQGELYSHVHIFVIRRMRATWKRDGDRIAAEIRSTSFPSLWRRLMQTLVREMRGIPLWLLRNIARNGGTAMTTTGARPMAGRYG